MALTDVATFNGIRIMPYAELLNWPRPPGYHRGGPLWPEWRKAGFARHHAYGRPRDARPTYQKPTQVLGNDHAFWAGAIGHHFGHQIMDFSMRLLATKAAAPDATFVFSRLPGQAVPPYFHAITDWFAIDRSAITIIDNPPASRTFMSSRRPSRPIAAMSRPRRWGRMPPISTTLTASSPPKGSPSVPTLARSSSPEPG